MPAAQPCPWQDDWFRSARKRRMQAWRGVESQHVSATMKLVDSIQEHEALEAMLEASKPPLPPGAAGLHYLLSTPFRYAPPHASRFRRGGEAGVWYGAESLRAACAEIAYWRYRFIIDSAGLAKEDGELVTTHTFFSAPVDGRAIDLTRPPWLEQGEVWTHPVDYSGTQALAAAARDRGVEWIRYASVRHEGACCAAVLSPSALAAGAPTGQQEWTCRATRHRVMFHSRPGGVSFSWDF